MSTVTPKWKLRRLASRGIRIVKRRAAQTPAVAAFLSTLVPNAEAYIAAYDRTMKYQASWKKEMDEGRGAIAALLKLIRSWLPLIKRDVPGFDASTFGDRPDVPDDVIEDGQRLASMVDEFRDGAGAPVPYQKALLELLAPALQLAIKEWSEAEAADSQYQQQLAEVRAVADLLQKDLVAVRQTLSAVVGRSDKDYLKLQVAHAATSDEDDDPNGPTPPQPVVAAAPGATVQPSM